MPDTNTNEPTNRLWTIPNAICALRMVGSLGIVSLAVINEPYWTFGLFLTLMATDWIDGKLAVFLDQRSTLGPRLDSLADAAMYGALLFAGVWLQGPLLLDQWIWIAAALVAYGVSCGAALAKFHRLPSYHTRSAKSAWLLMILAVVALFTEWSVWPFRIAMLSVAIANVEAVLITMILPHWQADVISFLVALRVQKLAAKEHASGDKHCRKLAKARNQD